MKKILFPIFFFATIMNIGCLSIPNERTCLYDINDPNTEYEIKFIDSEKTSYNLIRLELVDSTPFENTEEIKAVIKNSTDSFVKIKVVLEDETLEVLSTSEEYSLDSEEEQVLVFQIKWRSENEAFAYLTFIMEGNTKEGAISIRNIEPSR